MKNENTMILNHDTMLEAVQLWLAHNFKEDNCPKAMKIESKAEGNRYGCADQFHVTVKPAITINEAGA